ncbi:L,D-transpeptidase [Propionibacterium freudenreichii]|nr:L,D-transpeptidase [Propionibacterium freudenreichii]
MGWVENRILMWRPKNYWLAGSTAKVSLAFAGLVVGDGLYLADDTNYSISFGEAHVLRCNNSSQYMGVYQNDNPVKNLPVSTGTAAHPTLSGTKVIMEKLTSMIMDSSTYGVPATSAEGYKLKVDSCQRVTWSGEFIHAAPWSVAQQGNTPSSHGCVNVSPTEAAWLMSFTQVGDPVEFTGGGPSFQPATESAAGSTTGFLAAAQRPGLRQRDLGRPGLRQTRAHTHPRQHEFPRQHSICPRPW